MIYFEVCFSSNVSYKNSLLKMTEENLDNTTLPNIINENLFWMTIFLSHFIGNIKIEKCVKCCMMFEG